MTTASHSESVGSAPSVFQNMTEEQQLRFAEVLDRYLVALEQGQPLKMDALLRAHPDLAASFRLYFFSLNELHDLAVGFDPLVSAASGTLNSRSSESCRIGDFELGREIGRGGMGVVYEARQISLDRRVALK